MKKFMFFLLLTIACFSVTAQTSETYQKNDRIHDILVAEIADDVDGIVQKAHYDKNESIAVKITSISVPSYFDDNLTITILNRIIRQYSDLKVIDPWRQTEVNKIQTALVFNGEWAIIVVYRNNNNLLTVTSVLEQY